MGLNRRTGLVLGLGLLALISWLSTLHSTAPAQPLVIVVTPTYDRLTRYADILHLQLILQAALHPPPTTPQLHWLLVEDGPLPDPAILRLLHRAPSLLHTYIYQPTPPHTEHRGLAQRNGALDLIRQRRLDGIVYFADDDNALEPELLHQLAKLPKDSFTIFPVGNTGYFGFEGPVLESAPKSNAEGGGANEVDTTIKQWCCDFCRRRWNVDMGGMAFHTSLLHAHPLLAFSSSAEAGFLETDFLEQLEGVNASLVLVKELQERVHVWHDHSVPFDRAAFYDRDWRTEGTLGRRLIEGEEVVRGFSWANETLPRGRMV